MSTGSAGNGNGDHSAIPPFVFGPVEGRVHAGKNLFNGNTTIEILACGSPYADGYRNLMLPGLDGSGGDGAANPFGTGFQGRLFAVLEEDQEFLSAIAPQGVIGANGGPHPYSDFLQHTISDEMPIGVVD